MRTLAVINQKGGTAKTTTTVNLAAALAEAGQRTLVLDLDPQCSASAWLGAEPSRTLFDCLTGIGKLADLIVPTQEPGLEIIPGSPWLANAERVLDGEIGAEAIFRRKVKRLSREAPWQWLLIDCPPSLGLLALNALAAADRVLIPAEAHVMALSGVPRIEETIAVVRDRYNPQLQLDGVLVCRLDRRTTHGGEVEAELRTYFKKSVYQTVIRENIRLAEAPSFHKSILRYDNKALGSEDYRALAKELITRRRKES